MTAPQPAFLWMVLERTDDGTGKAFGEPIALYYDHAAAVTFADRLLQQGRTGISVERWEVPGRE